MFSKDPGDQSNPKTTEPLGHRISPASDQSHEESCSETVGVNIEEEEEEGKEGKDKEEEEEVGGFINSEGEETDWDVIRLSKSRPNTNLTKH